MADLQARMLLIVLIIIGVLGCGLVALRFLYKADDRRITGVWNSLQTQAPYEIFTEDMAADLPEPARRYFLHAIRPGTPLVSSVHLRMKGAIRTKPDSNWMSMTAEQLVVPYRGFVWRAQIRNGLMRLVGADYYAAGEGQVGFWLWGLLPIVRSVGPDIARSSLGRLASESVFVPSSLLPQRGAQWEPVNDECARVTQEIDSQKLTITLFVEASGKLRSASMARWGNLTEDSKFALIPFGGDFHEERTIAGYTIPTQMSAGWWYGTERYFEFFRATVEAAQYR